MKLTGILLTSPSSYIFGQQLNQLGRVVTIAQCCWLFRQRARQAAAAVVHAVAHSRTGAAHAQKHNFAELDSTAAHAAHAAAAFTGLLFCNTQLYKLS